jgi:hypothetical protein
LPRLQEIGKRDAVIAGLNHQVAGIAALKQMTAARDLLADDLATAQARIKELEPKPDTSAIG